MMVTIKEDAEISTGIKPVLNKLYEYRHRQTEFIEVFIENQWVRVSTKDVEFHALDINEVI